MKFDPLHTKIFFFFLAMMLFATAFAQKNRGNYPLHIHNNGKDSSFDAAARQLQTFFESPADAEIYVSKIPALLAAKGYPLASVDSVWYADSATHINLYSGEKYNWMQLSVVNIDEPALDAAGFNPGSFAGKNFSIAQFQQLQQRLLSYYEQNGYPFAAVYLDSIFLQQNNITALLKSDKGILYHIDSIRIFGNIKLKKKFLQNYLGISNGSIYNKQRLEQVDRKMLELPYINPVQPSSVSMLGAGSILNLFLEPKRSSQVNFLLGLLPSNGQSGKMQLTADINLDLKNLFGTGEGLLFKWQQLQPKSPRLNLGYEQPYIFNSPFGFSFLFDLFKKDSNFIQISAQTGMLFNLSLNQTGKLFVQWQGSSLLEGGVDTNLVKLQKALPPNIDVSAVNGGIQYEFSKTNYKFNPRKGNELNLGTTVGIKNIKKSNAIINIKDPSFNYASLYDSVKLRSYQWRIKLDAAHYFPLGKSATFKTAIRAGLYNSPSVFRNELFQIGGYKLLRGFDEESIYASSYTVFTGEYRYLISLNSYLFGFADIGFSTSRYQQVNTKNRFTGVGVGMAYETKAGLLNMSFALGKRNDVKFNLRQASKIHFGYINYF
ncbi:MAG: POTRA domain-containing protein [Ferruginibacter sp.]